MTAAAAAGANRRTVRRVLLPAVVFSLAACGLAAAAPCRDAQPAAAAAIDVFLIAGQSNATGIPDDARGSPKVPAGSVLQYYGGRITDANDPVGNADPGSAWPQFGIAYHAATGRRVLFVPASMPASSLTKAGDFLGKGRWDESGVLFADAVKMAGDAMAAAGSGAAFAGVLWDQGEADALAMNVKFETAHDYKAALTRLIDRFHQHFGRSSPFFIFETGSTADKDQSGFVIVRAVQESVSTRVDATSIVFRDAVTFPSRDLMARNKVHYSQAGYNLMGLEGARGVVAYLAARDKSERCGP